MIKGLTLGPTETTAVTTKELVTLIYWDGAREITRRNILKEVSQIGPIKWVKISNSIRPCADNKALGLGEGNFVMIRKRTR